MILYLAALIARLFQGKAKALPRFGSEEAFVHFLLEIERSIEEDELSDQELRIAMAAARNRLAIYHHGVWSEGGSFHLPSAAGVPV